MDKIKINRIKVRAFALSVRSVVQKRVQQAISEKDADYGSGVDLSGTCGYASWALWKSLPGSHLVLGEYDDCTHAWVEYEGYIIDITATQFGAFAPVRLLLKTGKQASLYSREHVNADAEEQIADWYPYEWQEELTCLLEQAGVLQTRQAA